MNFSFDSVKLKSKPYSEDFYFDVETPRGHFFAVIDFASHDYANLNATLKGKLETIVGSFASLSDFSDELFLGFLAKEINNFVSNLAEQSGGPELYFSAALSLLSGNNLSYFVRGNVRVNILNNEGLRQLNPAEAQEQLGVRSLETPMNDQVQAATLQDGDVVLIMTPGVTDVSPADVTTFHDADPKLICESLIKSSAAATDDRTLVVIGGPFARPVEAGLPDSSALTELKASLASVEARLDAFTERERTKQSETERLKSVEAAELASKFSQQLEALRDDLRSKAASIDLLEFDEKLKGFVALLAGKANTADVLAVQRDVLKLGLSATAPGAAEANLTVVAPVEPEPAVVTSKPPDNKHDFSAPVALDTSKASNSADANLAAEAPAESAPVVATKKPANNKRDFSAPMASDAGKTSGSADANLAEVTAESPPVVATSKPANNKHDFSAPLASNAGVLRSGGDTATVLRQPGTAGITFGLNAVLVVIAISLAVGFVGSWLQSRGTSKSPETWSVKTSGNQVMISRLDGAIREDVTMNVAEPVKSSGEQTFSSYADAKRYLDTLSVVSQPQAVPSDQSAPSTESKPPNVTEITIKSGDSLKRLAQVYGVPPERLMELNPTISRWPAIRIGQKIFVPAAAPTPAASATPKADQSTSTPSAASTTQTTVGPGDSLNELARRFNTTPQRMKELNPQITNWVRIRSGQRVTVPTPAGG